MEKVNDVAIIGAGPAGIAAAIYLKRVGVTPVLIERNMIGGLLRNANLVENYPGFPEGIGGSELVSLLEEQLRKWRIKVTKTEVTRITSRGGLFVLHAARGTYSSRFLVIATGTRPKIIDLPGLGILPRGKVLYEITDIRGDIRGSRFLVIGGGDAAFDYALGLASRGCKVDIVFKSRKPRCIPLLLGRARKERSIRILPCRAPESVRLIGGKVILRCRGDRGITELQGDALLIACGREPEVEILSRLKKWLEKTGDEDAEKDGLFVVGDARRGPYRQAGIAVGDGIYAAMRIANQLKEDSDEDTR